MGGRGRRSRPRGRKRGNRRHGGALRRRAPGRRTLRSGEERTMLDEPKVPLPDLENGGEIADAAPLAPSDNEPVTRSAADLEALFDVPVKVSAVLGRARMEVGDLLRLGPGAVLELDRRVGEAIDIYVNDRLVARGEVVLVEDKLGVTMTEIIKADR